MPITRAKPVDTLYEECREADLVLVPDPALASALNRRIATPRFGPFATTPRRYAAGRRESAEDRTAFLAVIDERDDIPWKEVAYAVGNVLECWEHRRTVDAILDYPAYVTPATEDIVEILGRAETSTKRLAQESVGDHKDVAVVGYDQLTPLERAFVPADSRRIDPFTDGAFELPRFRLFDSAAAIVDAVIDYVTPENADQVAVLLDGSSRYASLVEAALESADIPYRGGPGFVDDPDHRAFLQLLRARQSGSGLRVADVRPILHRLGIAIAIEHNEKRVASLDHPELDRLVDFFTSVSDFTFAKAVERYEQEVDSTLDAFGEELDRLGLASCDVTPEVIDDLGFYLRSYDVPVDRTDTGVVLADATASAAVDRPAVFFLGLDDGWTHPAPRRPWVDRDAAVDRHLRQFQLLLQTGTDQHYLVQDERGGRPVTPCLYFEALLDESYDRFSDLESTAYGRPFRSTGDGFAAEPLDVVTRPVETLSQSSLNTFVNSPRDYLFGRLVESPDRDYFTVGTLFHDFAEVAVCHPAVVDAAFLDEVVEFMLETTRPFDRAVDRGLHRRRYRVGLETIVEYLQANPPAGATFLTGDSGWGGNAVADHFGLEVEAAHTEHWFEEPALGGKGKVDLVHGPTHLLDYKSGGRHSTVAVVRRSALDPPHDEASFQALLYLAWLRTKRPGERLEFTFFHFLESFDDAVTGEPSLDDCLTTVAYLPVTFDDHLASHDVYQRLRHDAPNACTKTFSQIEYDDYREIVAPHAFPEATETAELVASPLGQALHEALGTLVGEYTYVETGATQALRQFRSIRDSTFFVDDLDAFEAFLDERLDELNRYRSGAARFPVEGLGREPNYRRVDHRDLLLEGDG